MGSNDDNFSLTGYEPKDYFFTETYVEFKQESLTEQRFSEQRFTEDMDYDDAAFGQMLFKAYRRQVDHSEREGLSSGLSSSSMSQDRTGQPVVEGHERCQSGPSARNFIDHEEGRFSKNYGADQQRLQISELHFDKFHGSKKWRWVNQW